jgi:capsule biosynthesis phosphatase
MTMRIAIDLDGTICPIKHPHQSYAELAPLPGAVERMRALHAAGHYIILVTARHMATCGSNLGQVMQQTGKTTFDWLARHGIPYDEMYFGKPNAEVYIDDRALRFSHWHEITDELLAQVARAR